MGDDESLEQSMSMREKIMQRERASRLISWVIPTMHTQLMFNDIAGTSLSNHLKFLDQTNAFHEEMRLYFYPKIFEGESVQNEDWESFTPVSFHENRDLSWLSSILPLLVAIFTLCALVMINVRKL